MSGFRYSGVSDGRKVSGIIEALSMDEAQEQLRSRSVMILELRPTRMRQKASARARNRVERLLSKWMISKTEIEQAFRQMVILLKGDVPVVETLNIVQGMSKGLLAKALYEVCSSVKEGQSLTQAMREYMPFIGGLQLGLIHVGETNGSLPAVFTHCVDLMAQARTIRNQIVQAMVYPAIVLVMGAGVGYYVSAIAIPKIASVLDGDIERLPRITRALLGTSDWIREHGFWLVLAPILVLGLFRILRQFAGPRMILDTVRLRLPLFGKVFQYSANALWNRIVAVLLESGVTVIESLKLTRDTLPNRHYRRQFEKVRAQVLPGKSLSTAMELSALSKLSPLSVSLAQVGENAGNTEEGLNYVSEYYSDHLSRRLDLLSKLVEPALIVLVGGMVAFVYVAFFMGVAALNAGG